MKRVLSSVLVAAVAAGAALVPSAASAAGANKADPAGDVVAFEGTKGTPSEAMLAAADIARVQVVAKAKRVEVKVTGVDFQSAEENQVGLMGVVQFSDGPYSAGMGMFYSAADPYGIVPVGFRFDDDCNGKGSYDPAASTLSFTFPRACFGTVKRVSSVSVETSGYDVTGKNWAPTTDIVTTKGFRLPWAKGGKKK